MKKRVLSSWAIAAVVIVGLAFTAHATTILETDFTGVSKDSATGIASDFTWDTVNGIEAPPTSLTFYRGDDGTTPVGFHNVTDDEIDVNRNMTDGGWDTNIAFDLDLPGGYTAIQLSSLILDMRLTTGGGADNTTQNKTGAEAVTLTGSISGVLGSVSPAFSGYPGVTYQSIVDLTSLPELDDSETYTLLVQARGDGWGHHKSLQGLELTGTLIPEPGTVSLLGLFGAALVVRRRLRRK